MLEKNFFLTDNKSMIKKLRQYIHNDPKTLALSFVCLGGFVVTFVLLAVIYHFCYVSSDFNHETVLTTGFTVTHNNTTYENVDLSEFTLEKPVCHGDVLTYSVTLPATNTIAPYLNIYAVHSAINVYVDQHCIYSFGHDRYQKGLMLGYGPHAVPLPYDYAGRKLLVSMKVLTPNSFSDIKAPYIINGVNLFRMHSMTALLTIFSDVTLIIMGLLLGFFSIVFSFSIPELRRISYLSGFAIGMGLWTMCANDVIFIFTPNPVIRAYIEYPALYISPLLFLLYVKENMLRDKSRFYRRSYNILLWAHCAFILIAAFLHFSNILQLPDLLTCYHLLLGLSILMVSGDILHSFFHHNVRYKFMTLGILLLIVTAVFDLVHFNLQKYSTDFFGWSYTSHIPIPLVFFVFLTILDFFLMMRRNIYAASYAEALEKIAYIDVLTGLANRRKAEDVLDEMDTSDHKYMVISIDLNYLKKVNDNLGHEMGDKLIKDFARILQEAYGEGCFVARMGGDEFMVVLPDLLNYDYKALAAKMNRLVADYNRTSQDLFISFASGHAIRGECNMTASRDYLKLADVRMYENKMAMKAGRSE